MANVPRTEQMASTPGPLTSGGASHDASQVLAQANLLRVRGLWDEAVERCMTAMKLDPDGGAALSLLGDIYENQGRLPEAIQWYSLALDKCPESSADQVKLKSAQSMLEHNTVAQAPELLSEAASKARRLIDRPFNYSVLNVTLRVAAYGLALAFAIVVGYSLSSSLPHSSRWQLNNRNLQSQPVVVQSGGQDGMTFLSNSRDSSELALLNTLGADPQLTSAGICVSDVSDDPRSGQITVTGLFAPADTSLINKTNIMRAALRIALDASAHTDPESATGFTIRILLANSEGSDTLIFAGDVSRANLSGVTQDLNDFQDSQLIGKFDNPWWSSGFAG